MIAVEWDEVKRLANLAKHECDFRDVPFMDWDHALVIPDLRFDYPEPRFWAFAMLGWRLHMAVICYRGKKVRVISFRKANDKEIKLYGTKAKRPEGPR
jgi:uncharacterized protein